jgi:hypothetical protein
MRADVIENVMAAKHAIPQARQSCRNRFDGASRSAPTNHTWYAKSPGTVKIIQIVRKNALTLCSSSHGIRSTSVAPSIAPHSGHGCPNANPRRL